MGEGEIRTLEPDLQFGFLNAGDTLSTTSTERIEQEDRPSQMVVISKPYGPRQPARASQTTGQTGDHIVQFYEEDSHLIQRVAAYIGEGITEGETCVVIATESHRVAIADSLLKSGIDLSVLADTGQYFVLDASETLDKFMDGDNVEDQRCQQLLAGLIAQASARGRKVRAFGEMVAILFGEGKREAAIRLEQLWDVLVEREGFSLYCAYPISEFSRESDGADFVQICHEHAHVIPAESFKPMNQTTDDQLRAIALLQQKAVALEAEMAERKRIENELREKNRTLDILHRVAGMLVAEPQIESVVQVVTDAGREICGAAFAAFFYNQVDERGESYALYTLSGVPYESFANFAMPRNTDVFRPTFQGTGIVRAADITKDPRYGNNPPFYGMPEGHLPVRSYLAVPVVSKAATVLGGLFCGHPDAGVFDEDCEKHLVTLAAHAAVAIENSQLQKVSLREFEATKRAEETSRRIAAIVAYSDDAIVSKDLNGIIQSWNAGAERIFGYTEAEVLGRPVTILIPANRLNEEQAILERIRSGQHVDHYETIRRRKDGSLVDVSLTISPIFGANGEVVGASKIARDISTRIQHEVEMHRANEELAAAKNLLEVRVLERTEALQRANKELEGFTYSVSHDLRAPLRGIVATSKILLEESSGKLSEDECALLVRQAGNANKLATLIDDLLKLCRLTQSQLHPQDVNLSLAATRLAEELVTDEQSIEVQPGIVRRGDATLLQLVLVNLIENAVKFSNGKGTITIGQVGSDPEDPIFVRDEGIGFDMAYVTKLFLPFERLHRDDEFPGTGIGLANVQRIIARHGGRVWAQSALGEGATFYFTLPGE